MQRRIGVDRLSRLVVGFSRIGFFSFLQESEGASMSQAIVLSGGGARGAFQVGVLKKLFEQGVQPEIISGTSIGAVNGFFAAQGSDGVEALETFWRQIEKPHDVYISRWFAVIFMYLGWQWGYPSIYKPGRFQKLLRKKVRKTKPEDFVSEFRCGAVDLISGVYRSINQSHPLVDQFLMASMSVPLAFPAKKIKDKDKHLGGVYVDGAVRNVAPMMDIIRQYPDVDTVHLVMTSHSEVEEQQDRYKRFERIVARTVDLNLHEIFLRDIESVMIRNELARRAPAGEGEASPAGCRPIQLRVYQPLQHDLEDLLAFNPDHIEHAIEAGELAADMPIGNDELRKWFDLHVTDGEVLARNGREYIA